MPSRGAKTKRSRTLGAFLVGSIKAFQRRPYKAGQHGPSGKRITQSDYALQLKEKQKVKLLYGLREAQLRRFYARTTNQKQHSETLLGILERRADNVIYRAGFALSRAQARQMITHGKIMLNQKKMTVPSNILKPGDVLHVRGQIFNGNAQTPKWLKAGKTKQTVEVAQLPDVESLPVEINQQLIVEFYSR